MLLADLAAWLSSTIQLALLALLFFATYDETIGMNMFKKKDRVCKQCGVQPCFGNFDYCSKTCGQAAKNGPQGPPSGGGGYGPPAGQPSYNYGGGYGGGGGYGSARGRRGGYGDDDDDYEDDYSAPSSSGMCKVCRVRPVHANFEFCSKACGRFATQGHSRQGSDARQGYGQGPSRRRQSAQDDDDDDDYDDEDEDEDSGYGGSGSPGAVAPYRGSTLCMNCHQYPKVTGRDFCSKACLNAAASRLAASTQNGTQNFQFAGVAMPNFANGGQRPPFPGGNPGGFAPIPQQNTGYSGQGYPPPNWQGQQQWQPGGYPQIQAALAPQPPPPPPGKPCKIMNCNGTEFAPGSKYCSNKCRKAAVKQGLEIACLMCKELPKAPKRHFCGKGCSDKAEKGAPILLDVPKTDPKFADIVKQFNDTWQGTAKPTVHRICKVVNSKAVEDRFQAYRQKVEQAGNWVSQGKTAGNENRRWHGTVRECTVGDDPNKLDMCTSTSCRLCCVIRTSFDMKYVAVGVYGLGIYTSAYSSTSHGYTRVATKGSPYRAMFLTRIVTGKEHIFTSGVTDPNAKAPPAGYDSVAVCAKHSALIVFQNEAICPSWLVLYS